MILESGSVRLADDSESFQNLIALRGDKPLWFDGETLASGDLEDLPRPNVSIGWVEISDEEAAQL